MTPSQPPEFLPLRAAAPALGAALLFGASTPLAKLLGVEVAPQMLAGLLYLGSCVGLALVMLARLLLRRGPSADAASMRIRVASLSESAEGHGGAQESCLC